MVVVLDGAHLTCEQVHRAAHGSGILMGSTERAEAAWRTAGSLVGPVYGQTTGVGANKDVPVEASGLDLLRSHAGGAGPLIEESRARATLVVRLNQLLAGGSGLDPALLPVLASAVNHGLTPPIRGYGAIGTGDLTALATTALCLLGELPWTPSLHDGHARDADDVPGFALTSGDALPFISSGAATLADAALACHRLRLLLTATTAVAAHSFRAIDASLEPLAQAVQRRPNQAAVAAGLRALVGATSPRHVQDPYGYRAFPQVHGAVLDILDHAERAVTEELNAAPENPLIADGRAWHNGNFHSAQVALALDALRAALVQTATLSATRLTTLTDPAHTGLLPFLAERPGLSGVMILEYVAHSALAALRQLASPVTLGTGVLSLGTEDHASFTPQAARSALAAVEPFEIILACELVAAVRALRQRGLPCGLPLDPAMADRPLDGDIDAARGLLSGLARRCPSRLQADGGAGSADRTTLAELWSLDHTAAAGVAVGRGHDHADGRADDAVDVPVDRGEPGGEQARHGMVVVAHHGHVGGDPEPLLPRRRVDPVGDRVGEAEEDPVPVDEHLAGDLRGGRQRLGRGDRLDVQPQPPALGEEVHVGGPVGSAGHGRREEDETPVTPVA
ncbi:histidine ammonia-lyase [Streptosporangium lutulentum]|uniref:Histidine ammonia-lyase n=1 Tax=Streptosporangium lutulentum TaxID=1461250 RepID=A0ABT9QT74_9ACTN|nr:histidine ammonia-lyase [Streptosporangium lutulentum]